MRNPLIYLLFLTLSYPASAFDDWTWSGFASIGGGKTNHDGLTFMDYDEDWSFDSDSVVGLHLQGDIAPQLSLTTQIVAQGFHANDTDKYQPEVDWLFLSYQWTPALRMRLGRMRTPHYLYSETVDAGYSYPWVRPPTEVYTFFLSPFYNFDGLDFDWNTDIGSLELEAQFFGGSMGGKYTDLEIKAEPFGGTNLTLRGEQWLLRYGIMLNYTDVHNQQWLSVQQQYEQLSQLTGNAVFSEVSEYFETNDQPYLYHAFSGQWDQESWTLLAEAYHISNNGKGFLNTSKGWYGSWFYHLEKWTPYLVYGYYFNLTNKEAISLLESTYDDFPAGSLGPEVELLRQGTIDGFNSFRSKQRSWTLGTRYDFHSNACVKAEVKYFEFLDGTTGLMIPKPGADRPENAILTSFTVDVVF